MKTKCYSEYECDYRKRCPVIAGDFGAVCLAESEKERAEKNEEVENDNRE